MDDKSSVDVKAQTPAALLLGAEPRTLELTGSYDTTSDTWSNRLYELAATKKHNESM